MPGDSLIEIKHLIRTPDPGRASSQTVRRLIHAVAEWEQDACLDITFGSHRRRRILVLAQYGVEQAGWEGDIAWAFRDIAVLGPKRSATPTGDIPNWDTVLDIRPSRDVSQRITTFADDPAEDHRSALADPVHTARNQLRLATPWPNAMYDDLQEMAELLAEHPNLLVRFRLAPASPIEIDMLGDTLHQTWPGGDADFHLYLGRPIRLRVLVGSTGGPVPARFRALARRWATSLSVVPLDSRDAPEAWDGSAKSLAGHTVPEGVALSLLRVPAAGNRPFPGMETRHHSLTSHPLDPVPPKPTTPIRLGAAKTVTGRRVDAALDVHDLVRHGFIEGQSGAGKSTLIAVLVRELTLRGYGCTLLDPHGTTIDAILRELPEGSDKTYVVRHEDSEQPIPLDIITGDEEQVERVVDIFAEMVQQMYDPKNTGIVGPRWRSWFSLIARATFHALGDEASLVSITEIGSDTERVRRLADRIRPDHPQLAKSLMDEIVNNRSAEAADLLSWCVSKLRPLVSTGQMRSILGTGHNAIHAREFVDAGKTLLIDLASPVLGEPASRMLGALWLLKHRLAMGTREHPETPHIIIVDEAHLFQFGALPNLLAEGRKFGLGVVVATQYLGQLRTDLAESLEANAGTLITLRTGLSYAQRSSVRLGGWPVEELVRLPNLTAAASISRGGTMTEPFTLTVDHHQRMARAGARSAEAAERARAAQERSRNELWVPFQHLEPLTAEMIDERLRPSPAAPGEGWSVVLTSIDQSRKIQLIKLVRERIGWGLARAKVAVEQLPHTLATGLAASAAQGLEAEVVAAGGSVRLEPPTQSGSDPQPEEPKPFLDQWLERRQGGSGPSRGEEDT